MAAGDIGAVIDTLSITAGSFSKPSVIEVGSGYFACVWDAGGASIELATFDVDGTGHIGAVIDSLQINLGTNRVYPVIARHGVSSKYAIIFYANGDAVVSTVDIDATGNIGAAVIDSHTIAGANHPNIIYYTGDVFVITYRDSASSDGFMATMDINSDGTIDPVPILDSWEYEAANLVFWAPIVHVGGTYFAIAWSQDTETDVEVASVSITAAGVITHAWADTLQLESTGYAASTRMRICHLGSGVCVVLGDTSAVANQVKLWSMVVSSVDGSIGLVVSTQTIATTQASDVGNLIPVTNFGIVVGYRTSAGLGQVITYAVSALGVISAVQDTLQFDAVNGGYAEPFRSSAGYYGTCAVGTTEVTTFDITEGSGPGGGMIASNAAARLVSLRLL